MNVVKSAASGRNQTSTNDCPPRQNSSRCGNNYIAAAGLNQESKISRIPVGENMNSSAALVVHNESHAPMDYFSRKQIDVLKNSICKGSSDEEFEVFLMACQKTQLDPFMRQIYAVKRWDSRLKREVMTVQTGIDGYRLIAERTERYAPGPEPTYVYDASGNLLSATAYIKKQTKDGTWHTVSSSAYIDEYCQRNKEGNPMGMWNSMPRTMLSKCAEAQALRKAFPAEMSGVYTKEEMQQVEVTDVIPKITLEQASELNIILSECDREYVDNFHSYIKKQYNTEDISNIPVGKYTKIKESASRNMEANHDRQRKLYEQSEQASEVLVESVQ